MSEYLDKLFAEFGDAAKEASEKEDKYIIIDRVHESLDDLSLFPFEDVLNRIVALVERFPELDYGPFGLFIEEQKISEYMQPLLESLYRQPSTQMIGWLARAIHDNDFQDGNATPPDLPKKFRECLQDVASNPKAGEECKDLAAYFLKELQQ